MVSFIILHYMVEEETRTCVRRLQELEGDFRIVIVDNCSPNGSGKRLQEAYRDDEDITVLLNEKNDGFARGNNLGCSYAREHDDPDFYVVMNNDIEIAQKDFLPRLYAIFEKEHFDVLGPDIWSTSARVHQSPKSLTGTTLESARRYRLEYRKKVNSRILTPLKCLLKKTEAGGKLVRAAKTRGKGIDYTKTYYDVPLHGACFVFSRHFARVRSDFFFPGTQFYYESEILDYECRLLSLKTMYAPSLRVLHHQNVSTNAVFQNELKRTRFMNEENYRSVTAFLRQYDRGHLSVAMFGHKRIPSREGGVEIVVEELASRMAAQGCEVTVFNRKGRHVSGGRDDAGLSADAVRAEKPFRYRGVRVIPVWTVEKKGAAAATSSLAAALRAGLGRYDIVHIHAEGPALMTGLLRFFRKPVVVTVHGLDWDREKWSGFARRYIKAGERAAVRYADRIIVLSESARQYFLSAYGRETVLIPNGVSRPEPEAACEITRRWGLEKDSYVLFLGRLVPEKGLRCLLKAWAGIHTEKKLVIAGGSSDTEDFVRELQSMAGENVIFTGFQQGTVLEELYSNACVYVLPSDLEGMPLSLLEALSYGCCVLVSDIEECSHVAEGHGLCFRKGDADDLREKLQFLLDHPEERAALKEGAAGDICRRYSWEDTVRRTLELYRSCLKENRKR